MKRFGAFLICLLFGFNGLLLTGCSPKREDHDQFLEIYAINLGYGVDWVDALAKDFLSLDWVKEKYPNGEYGINSNDIWGYANQQLETGPAINTADIMFGDSLHRVFKKQWQGECVLEDLSEIFAENVIGEDIEFGIKALPNFLPINQDPESEKYLSMSYSEGMVSIIYNATIFDKLGEELPYTTDQLKAIVEKVRKGDYRNHYDYTYAFQCSSIAGYWKYLFPVWWAQYEGVEEYTNFYNGVSENVVSADIFKQTGRLRALEVMDYFLDANKGFLDEHANVYEFMEAQTNLLMGKGLFMVNGDWLENEMRIIAPGLKAQGYDYDFRMMRTPVLSSLVEKTPSIVKYAEEKQKTPDEILAEVVKVVDAGGGAFEGITPEDFQTVKDARAIIGFMGHEQNVGIPSYASAKEMAKDFLRYLATDRANQLYSENTMGGSLPFSYDVQEKNPEYYETISSLQKDRLGITRSKLLPSVMLPSEATFDLVRIGGMRSLRSLGDYTFEAYLHQTGANRKTGPSLYNDDIAYWTPERWQMLVSTSGI